MLALKHSHIAWLVLGIACLAGLLQRGDAAAQTPTATPTTTATPSVFNPTILNGSGETGYAVNLFGPPAVTVAAGTTITFKGNWIEPHTITYVPAGQQPPPLGSPQEEQPTDPGRVPAIDWS